MNNATSPTANPPAQRILIVRPSALGDVARTVPALATLRHHHPHARIDWLVADPSADAIAHHPMLDNVVAFPRHELAGIGLLPRPTRRAIELLKQLRQPGYDTVYDLQGLLRSGLLTRLSGAPRRVGFANARELGWLGCNVRHRVPEKLHAVDHMLALLQAERMQPVADMRLYVGQADQQWRDDFLTRRQIDPDDYLCLAPTARWQSKCWPIQRYTQLAQRLLSQQIAGRDIILLSSPSERGQVQPLLQALSPQQRRRVHFPRTSVGQMMALLHNARLLVANDSAALHIAVGLQRPVVALFGPTDPASVGPYQRDDAVVRPPNVSPQALAARQRHDPSLIAQISLDQLWQALLQQLDQSQPRTSAAS